MTAPRNRRQVKAYARHLKHVEPASAGCTFCKITSGSPQFVSESKHFKVIHNLFPYSIWDGQTVADHLLLIPKLHTDTLSDLGPEQAHDFLQLISRYESAGYNVYARAPGSSIKTMHHQHTHLIKPGNGHVKIMVYLGKPYIRLALRR